MAAPASGPLGGHSLSGSPSGATSKRRIGRLSVPLRALDLTLKTW